MQAIIHLIGVPLLVLNWAGMVVGIIWAVIVGEWSLLLTTVGAIIIGTICCTILLIPGMLVAAPGMMMLQKGGFLKILSIPLVLIGFGWTYVAMSAWAGGSFLYFYDRVDKEHLTLAMLFAYAVATAPWQFFAQKEAAGDPQSLAPMTAFFLQLACALAFIFIAFFDFKIKTTGLIFGAIMLVPFFIQLATLARGLRGEENYY
jgi:hypothetical protein